MSREEIRLETRVGVLRGEVVDGVARFFGVPYAEAPVGPLRWERPQPLVPRPARRGTEIDARRFGPAALQLGGGSSVADRFFRPIRGRTDESCLYLNIWAPLDAVRRGASRSRGEARAPILVWFHGGGFIVGSGGTFVYDGTELAKRRGVILVTVNYRLGALGFLDLRAVDPEARPTANVGLHDQIAAVEWVREHAEVLGGAPDGLTLFGESAGAMSLGCLLAARPDLARRWILQSGAASHVNGPKRAAGVSGAFLDSLEIAARDHSSLLDLEPSEILAAQRSASLRSASFEAELPWQPSVGDELLPVAPLELVEGRSAGRELAGVEVVVGTNRDEWKLFAGPGLHLRLQTRGVLQRRVERLLRLEPSEAESLLALYEGGEGSPRTPFDVWTALRSDDFFRAPAVELADRLVASGARVYFYRFDAPVPRVAPGFGACHGAELPYVFGTFRHRLLRLLYGSEEANRPLEETVQTLWTSFARDGVPRARSGPDSAQMQWPEYGAERRTLLIDRELSVASDPEPETLRWWREVHRLRRERAARSPN